MLKDVLPHLENSLDLFKSIQAGDVTTTKMLRYWCSLDVVSLYTSTLIQEAITNATDSKMYSSQENVAHIGLNI